MIQAVSRKFYRTFVPTALYSRPSEVCSRGTQPIYRRVHMQYILKENQKALTTIAIEKCKAESHSDGAEEVKGEEVSGYRLHQGE